MLPLVMDSTSLALLCHELADNKKAEDIVILDMRKVSGITDFFVIASGTSEPHLKAIVQEITTRLAKEHGVSPIAMDAAMPTNWAALDYFDVIVHVMQPETRSHYDLEGFWRDAPRLTPNGELCSSPRSP